MTGFININSEAIEKKGTGMKGAPENFRSDMDRDYDVREAEYFVLHGLSDVISNTLGIDFH